ncbi:DUF2767 family protein [Enterobacter kobei]|uniref:DUF2767 family protein n=1 Tax=Enterobacter kobei TaxID=208224 RepID=UPI003BBB24C7
MCQVVGSIVFSLVEAGHDSTSENIISVLRNGLAESGNGSQTRSCISSCPLTCWSRDASSRGNDNPRDCAHLTRHASGRAVSAGVRHKRYRRSGAA